MTCWPPVKGGDEHLPGPEEITIGDFQIDRACFDEDNAPTPEQVRCPNGCHPIEHVYDAKTGRLKIFFQEGDCQACPFAEKCPAKPATSPKPETPRRFISIKINDHKKEQRRRAQTTEAFHKRYAPRAGIEATNSELKRAHGLGNLRVRRRKRVELAVYLKALACNMKRYVRYHVDIFVAACRGTVPALCM